MICVALRVECRLGHSGVKSRDRQLGFVTTVSPVIDSILPARTIDCGRWHLVSTDCVMLWSAALRVNVM